MKINANQFVIKVSKRGLVSGEDYSNIAISLMNKFTDIWWMNGSRFVSDAFIGHALQRSRIVYGNNRTVENLDTDKLRECMNKEWVKVDKSLKHPVMVNVDTMHDMSLTVDLIKRIVAFKDFDKYSQDFGGITIATSHAFDYYTCTLITDVLDNDSRPGDLSHIEHILEPFLNMGDSVSRKFTELTDARTDAINECIKRAEEDLADIEKYRSQYTIYRHLAGIATYVEQIINTIADYKLIKEPTKSNTEAATTTISKCYDKMVTHWRICLAFETLFDGSEESKDIFEHIQFAFGSMRQMTPQNLQKYWAWFNQRICSMTPEERVSKFGPETAKLVEGIVTANRNNQPNKA